MKLTKLREIGMKLQVGGVGYYPSSGSPFVHMDVGGVRAWPRMDRQQLVRLFPDGKTMHIPADGKPLPGYQQALADYKRRMASDDIQIASASSTKHRGFFAALFGGGADEDEDNSDSDLPATTTAAAPAAPEAKQPEEAAPAETQPGTQIASLNAPVPLVRPAFGGQSAGSDMASALVSPTHSAAQEALAAALPGDEQTAETQPADLKGLSIPVPSLLADRASGTEVASADPGAASMTDQLVSVPVPAERPALAEKLLAAAEAEPEAADDAADQSNMLSPAIVAALEQGRGDENVSAEAPVPASSAVEAINAAAPAKTPASRSLPTQMAALAPPTDGRMRFNDAFNLVAPQVADTGIAVGQPAKGGRPNKQDAQLADELRATVRTEPKLTQKIISQWALTNARMETVAKPVKAPRFVSQTLRIQPTAVYTNGFTTKTASIDAERFSGSAVNFMAVKKFDAVQ